MIFPGFRFIAQTLNEVDGVELENFVMADVFNEGCKIYERLHFVAFDVIVCPLNIKRGQFCFYRPCVWQSSNFSSSFLSFSHQWSQKQVKKQRGVHIQKCPARVKNSNLGYYTCACVNDS